MTRLALGLLAALAACDATPAPAATCPPPAAPASVAPAVAPAPAPDDVVAIGERQTFRSAILGEDRTIFVYTPPSYLTSDAKYPVLVLLDAETNFHPMTGVVDFLARRQRIPEMIVVGVTNTVRDRDLTPTAIAERPNSGGGDAFLRFLREEVAGRIEATGRTVPYRVLIGHSLGGLFAIHALTSAPAAFDAYVSISPSLWWDDERMRRNAEARFAGGPELQAFLYMTIGDEPGRMLDSNRAFAALLGARAPKGLRWSFKHMEREDHGSLVLRTTYDALEALFADYPPPRDITEVKQLAAHYAALSDRLHYTVKPPEFAVNTLAYGLLPKQPDRAIAAFEYNVELYPGSANVYDSLGEAYEKTGKLDLARTSYASAVEKATANKDPLLAMFKANLERVSRP